MTETGRCKEDELSKLIIGVLREDDPKALLMPWKDGHLTIDGRFHILTVVRAFMKAVQSELA